MDPWIADIGKEIVVAIVGAGLTWIGGRVQRLARDVNAFFGKIRDLESRVTELEKDIDHLGG